MAFSPQIAVYVALDVKLNGRVADGPTVEPESQLTRRTSRWTFLVARRFIIAGSFSMPYAITAGLGAEVLSISLQLLSLGMSSFFVLLPLKRTNHNSRSMPHSSYSHSYPLYKIWC
jgi:hypothetical protein